MITPQSGDLFERTHACWIELNLPSYQTIWSSFIGNDQTNRALPLLNLDEDGEARRGRFAQAHYSLAITGFHLHAFKDSALESIFPQKPSLDQFLAGHERLFLFMAHVGHVRDMFLQMETALGVKDGFLSSDFKGFYEQRSRVIHGPQMPIIVDDLSWLIPPIASGNESAGQWHKNAHWGTMKVNESNVYVVDFIRTACAALFQLITKVHPRVFEAANRFFDGRRIIVPSTNVASDKDFPEGGYLTDGSANASISAGSSVFKIRANPSGKRDP